MLELEDTKPWMCFGLGFFSVYTAKQNCLRISLKDIFCLERHALIKVILKNKKTKTSLDVSLGKHS